MIVLQNLSKTYEGAPVLHNFSCTLELGHTICVLGSSGRGKTTLLRLLMGLESPDGGTIQGLKHLRQSAVFQEDRLCPTLDVTTNLLLPHLYKPSPLTMESLEAGLVALGLEGCGHQGVDTLSGGMKRRVALLRALLVPFDVLFLDEPFKGLDQQSKAQAIGYLQDHTVGKTVFCITHDPGEVSALSPQQILSITPEGHCKIGCI